MLLTDNTDTDKMIQQEKSNQTVSQRLNLEGTLLGEVLPGTLFAF